MDMAENADIYT